MKALFDKEARANRVYPLINWLSSPLLVGERPSSLPQLLPLVWLRSI